MVDKVTDEELVRAYLGLTREQAPRPHVNRRHVDGLRRAVATYNREVEYEI